MQSYRKKGSFYGLIMAYWTPARLFEALPFFEDEAPFSAFCRSNNEGSMNAGQALPNMFKVVISFFFSNLNVRRDILCRKSCTFEERYSFMPDCIRPFGRKWRLFCSFSHVQNKHIL